MTSHKIQTKNSQILSPDKINYIAFRGGGGKGIAYIGALAALAELKFLEKKNIPTRQNFPFQDYVINRDKIKGVSGSSAGAITATLFALGYSLTEIIDFSTNKTLLEKFYDDAKPRMRSHVVEMKTINQVDFNSLNLESTVSNDDGKTYYKVDLHSESISYLDFKKIGLSNCEEITDTQQKSIVNTIEDAYLEWQKTLIGLKSLLQTGEDAVKFVGEKIGISAGKDLLKYLLKKYGSKSGLPSSVIANLTANFDDYLVNLLQDYGLFSGCFSRDFFAFMIALKMDGNAEATFDEFYQKFKTDLILPGTNLLTLKNFAFSKDNSPKFKIVDALRISMSIPPAFKPVIINEQFSETPQEKYFGIWTDGGVSNNLPIHVFDNPDGSLGKNVLGLSLAYDPEEEDDMTNIFGYLDSISSTLQNLANNAQIRTAQEANQVITLPIVFTSNPPAMKTPKQKLDDINKSQNSTPPSLKIQSKKNNSEQILKLSTFNFTPDKKTIEKSIQYSYETVMKGFYQFYNPAGSNIVNEIGNYLKLLRDPPPPLQVTRDLGKPYLT